MICTDSGVSYWDSRDTAEVRRSTANGVLIPNKKQAAGFDWCDPASGVFE
jgi:hypothetical protein